jgi:hypothetical protein
MQEEKYEGPRSDYRLRVALNTTGQEVIVSGHMHVQAWHPEGERTIFYSLLRDGSPLYKRVIPVKFVDGRLEEFISLSHIDLPPAGHHVYEMDLFILSEQGEPVYTGQPFFDYHMRVREI